MSIRDVITEAQEQGWSVKVLDLVTPYGEITRENQHENVTLHLYPDIVKCHVFYLNGGGGYTFSIPWSQDWDDLQDRLRVHAGNAAWFARSDKPEGTNLVAQVNEILWDINGNKARRIAEAVGLDCSSDYVRQQAERLYRQFRDRGSSGIVRYIEDLEKL